MSNTSQVADRRYVVKGVGTVRVSLVKLPANHGGMFESAVFLPNGDALIYARNYVLDYAVDMFETLCTPTHLASFIESEQAERNAA